MATTTKTLTPTNQTITLPDMTERPNASVLVDGIGKDADAINALSEQIANKIKYVDVEATTSASGNVTLTVPTGCDVPIEAFPVAPTSAGNDVIFVKLTYFYGNFLANLIKADGTPVASTSVKFRVVWTTYSAT